MREVKEFYKTFFGVAQYNPDHTTINKSVLNFAERYHQSQNKLTKKCSWCKTEPMLFKNMICDNCIESVKINFYPPKSEVSDEEIEKEANRRIRNNGTLYGRELKRAYRLGFKTSIKWMQEKEN